MGHALHVMICLMKIKTSLLFPRNGSYLLNVFTNWKEKAYRLQFWIYLL